MIEKGNWGWRELHEEMAWLDSGLRQNDRPLTEFAFVHSDCDSERRRTLMVGNRQTLYTSALQGDVQKGLER